MSAGQPVRGRKERTHSAKPYSRPKDKSLVAKVKNYLPSWIALPSWLGGSDNTIETVRNTEDNVSDDEQEAQQREINEQAAVLREPYGGLDIAGPSGINTRLLGNSVGAPSALKEDAQSSSSYARCPLQRTAAAQQSASGTGPPLLNGDDQSDNSETSASTSGCSSLAPSHQEKRKHCLRGLPISKAALEQIRTGLSQNNSLILGERRNANDTVDASSRSTAQEMRDVAVSAEFSENEDDVLSTHNSLWSEDDHINNASLSNRVTGSIKRVVNSRPQPMATSKRPRFSASAFGAPIAANLRQALFDGSLGLSPFYDGRTTFGGASAYRRARACAQIPYKNEKSKVHVRETSSRECMSSAAKRILNTLEKMSTPLQDAKKIPTESQSTDFALSFTPASYRRRQLRPEHKMSQSPMTRKLPTTSLPTPSHIVIGRNLQPMIQVDKRKGTPISDTVDEAFSKSSSKGGGKIRATTTEPRHFSSKPRAEDEVVEELCLPQIPLPITKLPTFKPPSSMPAFHFLPPIMTSTPVVNTGKSVIASDARNSKSTTSRQQGTFTFSTPIQPASSPQTLSSPLTSGPKVKKTFKFSNPSIVNERSTTEPESSPANFNFAVKPKPLAKKKTAEEPLKSHEHDQISKSPISVISPAKTLVLGGSVMDILGGGKGKDVDKEETKKVESTEGKTSSFDQKFKVAAGSWECTTCLVRNSVENTTCVACTMPKPGQLPPVSVSSSSPSITGFKGFGDVFKQPSGSWECSTCLVNNKAEDLRCVACEMPKPGSASKTPKLLSDNLPPKQGFVNFWKPPASGSWECDTCLVRNSDALLTKCQACETPRAGVVTSTSNTGFQEATKFQFGKSANAISSSAATPTFKFGLPASTNASATSVTTSSSAASLTIFGSPSISTLPTTKTGEFKFGLSTETTASKTSVTTTLTDNASGFVFGTPQSDSADDKVSVATTKNFVFGAKIDSSKDKPASAGFSFGITDSSKTSFGNKTDDATKTDSASKPGFLFASQTTPVSGNSLPLKEPSIPVNSNLSGVPFTFGNDNMKKAETETTVFGAGRVDIVKPSTTGNKETLPVASGFIFSSTASTGDKNTSKISILDSKTSSSTTTVTSTETLPAPGFKFSYGSSIGVDKGNVSSQGANPFGFKSTPTLPLSTAGTDQSAIGAAPNLFTFGNTASSTQSLASSTPSFVFGSNLNKTTPGGIAGFSFNTNTSSAPPAMAGFASSAQQSNAIPSLGSTNFTFGASAMDPKPIVSNPVTNPASSSVFRFGSPTGNAEQMTPIPSQQSASSLFTFGASANNVPGTVPSAPRFPTNQNFQFGNPTPSDSGVFRFGAPNQGNKMLNTGPTANTVTPNMSFGSIGMGAVAPHPPAFGQTESTFSFQTESTPSFGFGSQPTSTSLPNSTPQLPFNMTDNPFNGNAGNTTSNTRKIRKAVRRMRPNQ